LLQLGAGGRFRWVERHSTVSERLSKMTDYSNYLPPRMINVALDSSSQSQIARWCFWRAKFSSMLACSMAFFHFSHSCAKPLVISLSSSISHTQWQRPYLKSLLTQATTIEFMSHVVPTVLSGYLPHVVPKTLYMH
jgi:hypothetical protein